MAKSAIGIDLGGTNLKGVILNPDGSSRHLTRVPTEAEKGGQKVLENILLLIRKLLEKEGTSDTINGVGIGSPGFIGSDGVVIGGAENLPGWKGMQVFAPIKERFGLNATAGNDVTVAALAESRFGAGRGVDNVVCLALGTGIGGGIVINGNLYTGSYGMAGEVGHIVVQTDGIPCKCGQKGCAEQYASATGIANMARNLCKQTDQDTPFVQFIRNNPEMVSSKDVYDHVELGDPVAIEVHQQSMAMLARLCGILCNAFAPDRIILGGGVLEAGHIIIEEVNKTIGEHCWEAISERCTIVRAELGEHAGVLGSAQLVFEDKITQE
ncbi:MAG: ROK family protein [Chitinispirillaceae bacterium]